MADAFALTDKTGKIKATMGRVLRFSKVSKAHLVNVGNKALL
jgi:hypothetical protein